MYLSIILSLLALLRVENINVKRVGYSLKHNSFWRSWTRERSVIKVELLLLREENKNVKWIRLSVSQGTLILEKLDERALFHYS